MSTVPAETELCRGYADGAARCARLPWCAAFSYGVHQGLGTCFYTPDASSNRSNARAVSGTCMLDASQSPRWSYTPAWRGPSAAAAAQLQRLQGRQHELITAVAIAHRGGVVEFADVTRLCMRTLTGAEIDRYIAAEQPLGCAGGYKIEGLGIALFAAIDSEDHTAIVGLPLLRLAAELRQLGFAIP